MDFSPLPFRSNLDEYQKQAGALLEGFRSSDTDAIRVIKEHHPRFLRSDVPWLPRDLPDSELRSATRSILPMLSSRSPAGMIFRIGLRLRNTSRRARSTRVTHFDPPVHRATLLHYVAANGVEGYRQKTPGNAVAIATTLLKAGAEVDALADMYGGHYTTMCMLVSSCHPEKAGVQVALLETLLNFSATIEARGSSRWGSPLMTALAFGYLSAAEALVRHGARVDNVAVAAGLGRVAEARQLLAAADDESRHRALALAAQHGYTDIVRLLLDAGEDPSRYNPEGNHSHSTPLHQSILAGHDAVARLLVERGAALNIKDKIYRSTPLGWAIYAKQTEIVNYLRTHGAER